MRSNEGELYLEGSNALRRKSVAYVLVAGVNEYENAQFNLRYAAGDADFVATELGDAFRASGQYSRVVVAELLNREATKANLLDAVGRLAGRARHTDVAALSMLAPAHPEDTIAIFFAGHGWASNDRFYLVPHDLGHTGRRELLARDPRGQRAIKEHGISDEELEAAFESVDVANLMLIVDACNSGQALESAELRQGPFNSRGLAQLAWDKGMYVLTAAQSYQAALETSRLQHGFLTWALIGEGLKERRADRDPQDGQIDMREWFDYACSRVPEIQREESDTKRLLIHEQSGTVAPNATVAGSQFQVPRAFYRRDRGIHFAVKLSPAARDVVSK